MKGNRNCYMVIEREKNIIMKKNCYVVTERKNNNNNKKEQLCGN